jgi:hypothetical protein
LLLQVVAVVVGIRPAILEVVAGAASSMFQHWFSLKQLMKLLLDKVVVEMTTALPLGMEAKMVLNQSLLNWSLLKVVAEVAGLT